jgi:hypothetical protein
VIRRLADSTRFFRHVIYFACLAFCFALLGSTPVLGTTDDGKPSADPDMIRTLLARVDQLEARVQALELEKAALAKQVASVPAAPAPAPEVTEPVGTSAAPAPHPASQGQPMQMSAGSETPKLQIRGFSDIRYAASNLPGSTNSFVLGQFNLFVTSKLSDRFNVLSEVVTEADTSNNTFGIELERLLLNYHYSDKLNVAFGRYHSSIGFYNTEYHHSSWMQTTVDRPFLFEFEDGGGVLPIHNVGVTMNGAIPSGSLGLHYVAEIGNGRATRTQFGQNPVQNVVDENNGKSFNFALFARPEAVRGLQIGASGYHDNLTPLSGPNVDEVILSAYAVYQSQKFEFLNEAVLLHHTAADGTPSVNSPGFYSQISRQWGAFRPYFRYEYLNVPLRDLIFPDVHRMNGPLFGLRYNWGEYVALKIQYQRTMRNLDPDYNTLTLQTSFAF